MSQIIGYISHKQYENEKYRIDALDHLAYRTVCPSKKFIARAKNAQQLLTKKIADENYTILFHGDLYNKEQLRLELLEQGHTFSTNSDIEVLLSCYAQWGIECLEKIIGIYAFAIWSEQNETLMLARDRLGIKRLFYIEEEDRLIFATDYRDLMTVSHIRPVITEERIAQFITFGSKHSFYSDIKEIEPAHLLVYDKTGITSQCYWQLASKQHFLGINETADQIRDIVVDTVEKQLVGKQYVSTVLSEEVETSVLVALASNLLTRTRSGSLKAYVFSTENKQHDALVHHFSKYFPIDVKKEVMTDEQLVDTLLTTEIPFLINKSERSFSSIMFQQMQTDSSVILSHIGADELFGTYEAYYERERYNIDDILFIEQVKEIENCLNDQWKNKLQLTEYIYEQYQETMKKIPSLFTDHPLDWKRREITYVVFNWSMVPRIQQIAQRNEIVGKNVYFPFADHRIVEYMWNVPIEMKQLGGFDKGILRKAFEGIVPNNVLYRKKQNEFKMHQVYVKLWTEKIQSIVEENELILLEWFDKEKLKRLIQFEGTLSEQLKKGKLLISFIQLEKWLNHHI